MHRYCLPVIARGHELPVGPAHDLGMTNQNRVPAGVRAGGQYATTARSVSPVNLTSEQEDVRRIVADTRRAAGYASRRTGQDLDDVAGDALLAFAEAHGRGRAWSNLSTGEINTVVPRVAYRRMSGLIRGEEFDAFRQYRTRLDRIEQDEHRTVGDAERDRIADQVRASMPPRRRPKAGFHRPSRDRTDLRLDAQPTDTNLGVDVDHLSGIEDSDEIRQTAFDYRLAEVQQAKAEGGRWAAMSVLRPAPQPRPNLLTEGQATALRRRVAQMGGARALTLSWRDGEASREAADAYFAAFGDIDDTERDQVAETFMLAGTPENTDQVFSEVVSAATRRRPR